jgi:hypothetical protein
MRKTCCVLLLAGSLLPGSAAVAEQGAKGPVAPARPASHATRAPAAQLPFQVVATIKDLMNAMIEGAAGPIWNAVSTTVTAADTVEKAPESDEDWAALRNAAYTLIEGANLLMMPGRHVAAGSGKTAPKGKSRPGAAGGELDPMAIEARIRADRQRFVKLAQALQLAAIEALRAADAKDVPALFEAGGAVDDACERCHLRYWYPDQTKRLVRADKVLRGLRP